GPATGNRQCRTGWRGTGSGIARCPLPVPCSPFPVPRSLFPVPCSPFPVPLSGRPVRVRRLLFERRLGARNDARDVGILLLRAGAAIDLLALPLRLALRLLLLPVPPIDLLFPLGKAGILEVHPFTFLA